MATTRTRNRESRDHDTARGDGAARDDGAARNHIASDGGSAAAGAPARASLAMRLAWLVAIWAAGVAAVGTLSFLIRLWLRP